MASLLFAALILLAVSSIVTTKPFEQNFDRQVEDLLNRIKLSDEQTDSYLNIIKEVEESLQEQWPGCIVNPMGSISTGLALKGSDIDMAVEIPGKVNASYIYLVVLAKKQLEKHPNLFTDLITQNNRIPIVTFHHVPTGVSCDLNFQGYNAYRNIHLTKYFFELDERAYKLTLIIKYWKKLQEITKKFHIRSFEIALLVIFYLQQLAILPSVAYLQEGAERMDYNNWNYGFSRKPFLHNDDISLYNLLRGFFKFYSEFDFDKYVVSIYAGRPVDKELFITNENVPQSFALYKNNVKRGLENPLRLSGFAIQDPFEHALNVHHIRVDDKDLNIDFKNYLRRLSSILEETDEDNLLRILLSKDEKYQRINAI